MHARVAACVCIPTATSHRPCVEPNAFAAPPVPPFPPPTKTRSAMRGCSYAYMRRATLNRRTPAPRSGEVVV